jgi:hypothetical protein
VHLHRKKHKPKSKQPELKSLSSRAQSWAQFITREEDLAIKIFNEPHYCQVCATLIYWSPVWPAPMIFCMIKSKSVVGGKGQEIK